MAHTQALVVMSVPKSHHIDTPHRHHIDVVSLSETPEIETAAGLPLGLAELQLVDHQPLSRNVENFRCS